ncbi:MAG TPA: hypothetical protein VF521_15400 [Pyrinomonadaceae bacterium]
MNEWMLGDARYAQPRPRRAGGFWRRQFGDAPTRAQVKFDVLFGLVLPALCLYFDPLVFKSWFESHGGVFGRFQLYAYTISALEMLALCAWLFAPRRVGARGALLAGVLFAGAGFAFVVGVFILPFSAIGVIFIVGAFGFVPFPTGIVYLRNAWRALERAGAGPTGRGVAALACGFIFALGVPAVAPVSLRLEVAAALSDVRAGRELSPARLRVLRRAAAVSGSAAYDEIVWEYSGERDPARRARLAKAYAEITAGGDIERRLRLLQD